MKPITTQREWSLANQAHVNAAIARVFTNFLKAAVLILISLGIGAAFAWGF